MLSIRTILHATDFSQHSAYAFWMASLLARDHGARVVVLHVVQPPAAAYGETQTERAIDQARQDALQSLQEWQSPLPDVPVERRIETGDPAPTILRVAQETQSDLIVLGTHGRTGLDRLLMGSVAEEVVRKATSPVMVVKTPRAFLESSSGTPSGARKAGG